MKNIFLPWLLLIPFFGFGQVVDTVAVRREVDSLITAAINYSNKQEFDIALQTNRIAFQKASQILDSTSRVYSDLIYREGRLLLYKGENVEAEKSLIRYKAIRNKNADEKDEKYSFCLFSLASISAMFGRYQESELLLLESMEVRRSISGKNHLEYARCLSSLGILYKDSGRNTESEQIYLECKKVYENLNQNKSTIYAGLLINLGVLYYEMEMNSKSEDFYLIAKKIFEEDLKDKKHIYYINCLNNLANLYMKMGVYKDAEKIFLESKYIIESVAGKMSLPYSNIVENLGNLYFLMHRYDSVEMLYLESLHIRKNILGEENIYFAKSKMCLGVLHLQLGNYNSAEKYLLEAIAIHEKIVGKNHVHYAHCLSNLAALYGEMGHLLDSERLYLQSISIIENNLGKNCITIKSDLLNLAFLLDATNRYLEADRFFVKSSHILREHLFQSVSYLNEQQLNQSINNFIKYTDKFFSHALKTSNPSSEYSGECFDNTLFYKSFLLFSNIHFKNLPIVDSTVALQYHLYTSCHRRLAAQYAQLISNRDISLIADLEEKASTLEKELVRTLSDFGNARRRVSWKEVRDFLQPNETAIEFVHYRYYDQKARATDSTMYAVLILLPGDTTPHFVPLCEARQLDAIINRPKQAPDLYCQNIYSLDAEGKAPLYQTLWAPLEPYLRDVKTVYFSPSGLLHRLNLAAIQPARRETLGDRYHLVELGSTRQLVVPATVQPAANDAVLFGGIRYEMDSTKIVQANNDLPENDVATRGSGGFVYTDSTLRGGDWNYLPATEKEIAVTDKALKDNGFKTSVYRDYAATEEALLSVGHPDSSGSPRILHIATHGFFFPDPKTSPPSPLSLGEGEPVFKISDNPMIRSGLLLAGANYAWKTGKPLRPDMEDGILTAYEISQMNLRNTELVVLSACETGLGQIEGNEGVYGLQRAFKIAGAKYLLMSLWQVPDKHTQELMEAFYKNWLDGKMSIPDAFREAQNEMRKKYTNPFYWAGFVLVE